MTQMNIPTSFGSQPDAIAQTLITVEENRIFALSNTFFSYVFEVSSEGLLEHLYYGAPLGNPTQVAGENRRVFHHVAVSFDNEHNYNLNSIPLEYPCAGRSDFRHPALRLRAGNGSDITTLRYRGYRITTDKPAIDGLPSARGGESQTLTVLLSDEAHGLDVELSYTVYRDYGVLCRSTRVVNKSAVAVRLNEVASSSIDCPAEEYELLHLHGTWAREFNAERIGVPSGRFVIESNRGTSSFAHQPFAALLEKGATETAGEVWASALVYSGNFQIGVEKGEFGTVRMTTGMSTPGFEWCLQPGETFSTPEALHVYSGAGLREMSRQWHAFIRDKVSPAAFRNKPRPTYLNSWESAYFEIDEAKVLELADCAVEAGVEMLVVDDGWFEGRTTNATSLGDWTADKARFPSGIPALARRVKDKGLKFGLWLEPEMISEQSQLFQDHPDWVLCAPGAVPSKGRNQWVLDLSRDEVVEHLFEKIDALLSSGEIDYIKWDMNRPLTEVGSSAFPPQCQGEIAHRHILGLYRLLDQITTKYPEVLFENCASGGNRFDLGMLSFMAQGWISDMADPIGRLPIIHGASHLYPLDVTSHYIAPSPNHQNGRATSIATRFNAGAFCAGRGLSLNQEDIAADLGQIQALMNWANGSASQFVGGDFTRLFANENEYCWQYTEAGGARTHVLYFQILAGVNKPFRRAVLADLDPSSAYTLTENGEQYHGDALMGAGLPLPYCPNRIEEDGLLYLEHGDFTSSLLTLERSDQ